MCAHVNPQRLRPSLVVHAPTCNRHDATRAPLGVVRTHCTTPHGHGSPRWTVDAGRASYFPYSPSPPHGEPHAPSVHWSHMSRLCVCAGWSVHGGTPCICTLVHLDHPMYRNPMRMRPNSCRSSSWVGEVTGATACLPHTPHRTGTNPHHAPTVRASCVCDGGDPGEAPSGGVHSGAPSDGLTCTHNHSTAAGGRYAGSASAGLLCTAHSCSTALALVAVSTWPHPHQMVWSPCASHGVRCWMLCGPLPKSPTAHRPLLGTPPQRHHVHEPPLHNRRA